MKNKFIFGIVLLILFTTFIPKKDFSIKRFEIREINFEGYNILSKKELIKTTEFLFNKNIILLNSYEINKKIPHYGFIKRLEIKKIYPDKLLIKVTEKEPIAILINDKGKFFIDKNAKLINFRETNKFQNLPIVYGEVKYFKILLSNLKKINFPFELIMKYHLFESNRWDLVLNDKKIIKLPSKNYNEKLKNFIKNTKNSNFGKYNIFDYRLENQIILK
tara:strand:+ start:5656 stop:6312 length:657 start_codon:yes stop_codon:yes gene_type:complete